MHLKRTYLNFDILLFLNKEWFYENMARFNKGQVPWNKGKTGLQISGMKGKQHTEEARRKMSMSIRKAFSNPEIRKKLSESHKGKPAWWNKGLQRSEETRKRLSESHKGQVAWNKGKKGLQVAWNKGKHTGKMLICPICKKEFYARLIQIKRGRTYCSGACMFNDSEWRKKQSESKKGIQKAWNKGIPMREESKRKLGESNKRRMSNPEIRRIMGEISKKALANPEVRSRMSEAHKGQIAWNKGKSPSKETVEKQMETWRKTWLSNPEIRRRMSESHKGKKRSEEALRKFSLSMKGHKVSEETRRKISLAQKGKIIPTEYRKRISETLKRYMSTPEIKKKMSDVFKKNWANPELRKRMIEANTGEKSHAWRGGISFEPYSPEWTKVLKKLIKERDDYTCQLCNKKGKVVHHIDYNKKNCKPENLIALCEHCHSKTNYNREKWKKFFDEIMQQKSK